MGKITKEELLKAKIPGEETGIQVKTGFCGFCGGDCLLDFYIKDGKIIKESGFYFHKKQIIRLDKVQFTSSVYSPWKILRSLNLIILYAYGGFMVIIFLNNDKFAELKTFL